MIMIKLIKIYNRLFRNKKIEVILNLNLLQIYLIKLLILTRKFNNSKNKKILCYYLINYKN